MAIQDAILGLLAQRPRHGYELHDAFEAMIGGEHIWDLKPAQVYSTLSRLEKKGLIAEAATEQDAGPEKRIYDVTPAGRAELQTWFTTPVESEHQRDEFFLKLMLSLAANHSDPVKVIYAQRASLYQELHTVTTQRARIDPRTDLAHILLLDQVVMHLEADIRWLEMIEVRLDTIRRQPLPEPAERPRGRPPKGDR